MNNGSPRPIPTLRKEVVPTATFGDVVVRGLRLSERMQAWDVPEIEGEPLAERARRANHLFQPRLLAVAATEPDGTPLYTADEWDIWLGSHAEELKPVIDKAFALNGIERTVTGDAAKNA